MVKDEVRFWTQENIVCIGYLISFAVTWFPFLVIEVVLLLIGHLTFFFSMCSPVEWVGFLKKMFFKCTVYQFPHSMPVAHEIAPTDKLVKIASERETGKLGGIVLNHKFVSIV